MHQHGWRDRPMIGTRARMGATCGGNANRNHRIQADEERNIATRVEAEAAERDQLTRCGFSTEEIVDLLEFVEGIIEVIDPRAVLALRKSWICSGSDAGTKA